MAFPGVGVGIARIGRLDNPPPRALSVLFLVGGAVSLLVYQLPDLEPTAVALGIGWAFWLGLLLRNPESDRTQSLEEANRQPFPT